MIQNSLARWNQKYFTPTDVDGITAYFKRYQKSNLYLGIGTQDDQGGKLEGRADNLDKRCHK